MLDIQQKGVVTLVRNALLNQDNKMPEGFDFGAAVALAKKHGILNIAYYGAVNAGISQTDSVMQGLFMYSCQGVARSTQQLYELERLFEAFEKNGIDFMPLKGAVLKNLYLKTDMRTMGDGDILIKPEQYDKIKPIMEKLGFIEGLESDHELVWSKKSLLLELHKHLIPSYFKDYYEYFGNGWGRAQLKGDFKYRYCYSNEDEFVYLFSHFAKHYRDGGIGIKHLCDIFVFLKCHPELDMKYIETELSRLRLFEFYKNILATLDCWFEKGEFDEKSAFITKTIFDSGAFGTKENHNVSKAVKASKTAGSARGGKNRRVRQTYFPGLSNMKKKYPVLNKAPFLLPVMWIVRGIGSIGNGKLKSNAQALKELTPEKIESFQESLLYVGLDYNFKE